MGLKILIKNMTEVKHSAKQKYFLVEKVKLHSCMLIKLVLILYLISYNVH